MSIVERIVSGEIPSQTPGAGTEESLSTLRLLLIGPVPEPPGGVSIHISRLSSWLSAHGVAVDLVDEAKHQKAGVYNLRSGEILGYLRHLARCNIVHIHSGVQLFRILHIVASRMLGRRVIVTLHSGHPSRVDTWINRLFLRLVHEVILVNEQINNHLRLKRYLVLPAFLPPGGCRQVLPEDIQCFVDTARSQGRSLLCANAYELVENNGEDLYGLDLCVELMGQLAQHSRVKAALVYVVACDAQNNRLLINAQKAIRKYGLENDVCLYNRPVDFITLLQQSDVVLRPTNTDGDALTIREAIYFGVPVIASDVVNRPDGTILFKNRDVEDLVRRTKNVLENRCHRVRATADVAYDSYFQKYVDLYLRLLHSRSR